MTRWTPAIDAMMVRLWNSGAAVADIAAALTSAGHEAPTKGTILGRLHRLRSVGRAVVKRPAPKRDLSKAMTHRRDKFNDRLSPKSATAPRAPRFMELSVLPGDAENAGTEGPEGCRWILREIADGRTKTALYCGKTRIDRSWCEAHRVRVMQPAGPPKIEREIGQ